MKNSNFFQSQMFWWGLYYGLTSIAVFFGAYLIQPAWVVSIGYSAIGYVALPLFFMIFGGLAERKNRENGKMNYGQAYVAVLLIAFTGLVVYTAVNPLISQFMPEIQGNIVEMSKNKMIERLESQGMGEEQIEEFVERFDKQAASRNQVKSILFAFLFGSILFLFYSLFAALVVRNQKQGDELSS